MGKPFKPFNELPSTDRREIADEWPHLKHDNFVWRKGKVGWEFNKRDTQRPVSGM